MNFLEKLPDIPLERILSKLYLIEYEHVQMIFNHNPRILSIWNELYLLNIQVYSSLYLELIAVTDI